MDHTPSLEDVLNAYRMGLFPMAESAADPHFSWYEAPLRGLLPVKLHVPQRLAKTVQRGAFEIRVDHDFAGVIDGCAAETKQRRETWINRGIRDLFIALHEAGHAHCVECWRDGALVGGVYGLALGGAFCGESMFSRARDASKVALVHLAARLWRGGFQLFDTQLINPHLKQFGAYEVTAREYLRLLHGVLDVKADFGEALDEAGLVRDYLGVLETLRA